MKPVRSRLWSILFLGAAVALVTSGVDCWRQATDVDAFGIEQIIEMDREYFRRMQPVWDEYERHHPDWIRPEPTSEATYQEWRERSRKK